MSMRFTGFIAAALLASMLGVAPLGCTDGATAALSPGARGLEGRWITAPSDLAAHGWHQDELTLEADGRFTSVSRGYGLYEGQSRDALSTSRRIEGTYRLEGDRVHFQPRRLIWWDHYESADRAPTSTPYPWKTLFDDANVSVIDGVLVLRYNLYPSDVPVPVRADYTRAR
jgi:hypothetical protein